jgi:hypothetical protein
MASLADEILRLRYGFKKEKKSKEQLSLKFKSVKENSPKLFDMVCSHKCDDEVLNKMLFYHSQFKDGNLTQDKASQMAGGVLVDKYVKPIVPK